LFGIVCFLFWRALGIKAEDVGRLFKEFEQLESGASCHHEGTGLGLALVSPIFRAWRLQSPLHLVLKSSETERI
jgi:signal transduction histidine kinase